MAVQVVVPPLGTNVDTLVLAGWHCAEGEPVEQGQPLFSVETDKAVLDVESPASGILRRVSAAPGDSVSVMSAIAVIAAPGETLEEAADAAVEEVVPASPLDATPAVAAPAVEAAPRERVFISPRARRLAESRGVAWEALTGTGPEEAIVERDVRAVLGGAPAVPSLLPMAGVRALIAARMMESAAGTAPVTLTTEVDATGLVEERRRLAAAGAAVSYNDLLAVRLARALAEHPRLNASLEGDAIRYGGPLHLGLAVDTDRGLVVPVLRDIDRKPLREVAAESAALVAAARDGRLPPEAFRGGTFTLTNLGMYGIDAFTPVINLPECAILGVGRIKPRASVVGDAVCVRHQVWLSLTFDHRLVDGGPAARFLQRLSQLIEVEPDPEPRP